MENEKLELEENEKDKIFEIVELMDKLSFAMTNCVQIDHFDKKNNDADGTIENDFLSGYPFELPLKDVSYGVDEWVQKTVQSLYDKYGIDFSHSLEFRLEIE